jgi:DMSO/TMAO reductase YedYZ heme-binding membrane subunit
VAATLGVLHFLWLVKLDATTPAAMGFMLVALLAFRMAPRAPRGAATESHAAGGG